MKKNLIRKILLNVTLGGALLLPNILAVTTEAATATTKSKTDYLNGIIVGDTYQFGHYWQSYKGSGDQTDKDNYNKDAITWKVLANKNGIVTLLSEKILYGDAFYSESNVWAESEIRETLNNTEGSGFAGDAFTAAELAMIKENDNNNGKIYLLDYDDVKDSGTYGFSGDDSRKTTATEYAQCAAAYGGNTASSEWWLRSHELFDGGEGAFANYVMADGKVSLMLVNSQDVGVRPALDLDLSNLIFVTAAENGKTTATAGNSVKFREITDASTLDLWMDDTVNEDNRVTGDVAVGGMKLGKESDSSKITFNFTGATEGTDSYVSALFFNENGYEYNSTASELSTGNLVGYGKGNAEVTSADGTTEIDITELGTTGTYKAELFNENGMFIGKRAEVKGTFAWETSNLIYTVAAKDVDFDITVDSGSGVVLTGTGDNVLDKNIILTGSGELRIGDGTNATVSASLTNINLEGAANAGLIVRENAILNLIGEDNTLTKKIAGTGTVKIDRDSTLSVLADGLSIDGTLDGNGRTLNMTTGLADSAINTLTIGKKLTGNIKLQLDVDMNDFSSDKLAVTTVDSGANITVNSINVTQGYTGILAETGNGQITYLTATTDNGNYSVAGGSLVTVTNDYKYTFIQSNDDADKGKLNYTVEAVTITLKGFIEGTLADDIKTDTLSLTSDMEYGTDETTADMAVASQTNTTLYINLNGNAIAKDTGVTDAMTISTGAKTLNIAGGNDTAGSMDTNFNVGTGGNLNVSGNTGLSGNIANKGTVAFDGTTTVTGTLSGEGAYSNSGTLTVADASKLAMKNGLANAGTLNLGSATASELKANITGEGTTNIKGEVTSSKTIANAITIDSASKLTNTGTISGEVENAGTFITTADGITGGVKNTANLELTGTYVDLRCDITDAETPTGTTTISGTVINTNGKTITQNSLVIAEACSLTSDVDKLVIGTGNTTDNGDLILTGEGELSANIIGAGTTTIKGKVSNGKTIENAVTIDRAGTLITKANGITGGVKNAGSLELTTGDLGCAITDVTSSCGTTTISGTVTNTNNQTIEQNSLVIAEEGSLTTSVDTLSVFGITDNGIFTLTTGTDKLETTVTGIGDVFIDGKIVTDVEKLANEGTLGIKVNSTLELTSGNLTKAIDNDATGTVKLNGATLGGVYVETGTLEFAADTEIADAGYISAGTNVVDNGVTVTVNGGELKKDITGTGTLQLGGTVSVLTNQSIAGTLNGNGHTLNMINDVDDIEKINTLTVGTLKGDIGLQLDVDMSNFTSDKLHVNTANDANVTVESINIVKDYIPNPVSDPLELPKEEVNGITYLEGITGDGTYQVQDYSITVTNGFKYTFTQGDEGKLNYTIEVADVTLKKFIEGNLSNADTDPATLSLTADMTYADTTADMGNVDAADAETQKNDALTINLNGKQITKTTAAMTISTGEKILKINGGTGDTAGSMDTNFNVAESGKLEVSDKTALKGDINNEEGTVTFAGTTIVEGTLEGNGDYINNGTLTVANAAKLTMTGTNGLANTGTLNLGNATASALGADITGAGTTVIDGEVTSAKTIKNKVTLADGKKLTNTGTISGEVTNAGTFITKADGITGGVKNAAKLELKDGNLECNITDADTPTGTTTISGTVTNTNEKTITQKDLLIANTGSLTTDADKLVITNAVADKGNLILTGNTLGVTVEGVGNIVIKGAVSSDADNIKTTGTNEIEAGKTLTLTSDNNNGDTLTAKLTGNGAIVVDGTIKSDVINLANTGALSVKASSTLELTSGELKDKTLENAGTVKLNGATLGGACVKTGTLEIATDTSFDVDYVQAGTNTIDDGITLTLTSNGTDDDQDGNKDTLVKTIFGDGNLAFDGNIITDVDNILEVGGSVSVVNGKTLTFVSDGTGDELRKVVGGTGNIAIGANDKLSTIKSNIANLNNTGKLRINTGSTLELTSGELKDKTLENAGTVKLNGATLGSDCVKTGTLEFAAYTTVADAGYISAGTNVVDNGVTVTVNGGELKKDITGTGTVQLGGTVSVFGDQSIEGILDGNGQTLNMSDSTNINTLTVGELTGNINLQLDVDMSGNNDNLKGSDKIAVGALNSGVSINVTNINVTKDYNKEGSLPVGEVANAITYLTAGSDALTNGTYSANCSTITSKYKYTFMLNDGNDDSNLKTNNGKLNYKVESIEFTLKKFIEGTLTDADPDTAALSLTENIKYDDSTANMAPDPDTQSNSTLTINLNGHKIAKNTGANEMTISTGAKTLNINGGNGNTSGSMDTNFEVNNANGKLNVSGNTELTGNITNQGTLNANGTTTFAGEITNSGTANVDGTTEFNGQITNSGTFTAKGDTTFTGNINNTSGGQVTVYGTAKVNGNMTNEGNVTFNGTTTIGGNLTGEEGIYTNNGTMIVANASKLQMKKGLTNTSGIVNLGSSAKTTLGAKIVGGEININGNVSSDADFIQGNTNVVASGKTLTLTSNNSDDDGDGKTDTLVAKIEGEGNLIIAGNVIAAVGNIAAKNNSVSEGCILTLTETGTLEKKISGAGGLNFNGDITTKAANIATSGTNTVASGNTLTVEDGTLSKKVGGAGDIAISGTVKSTVDNFVNEGTLGVNADSILELTSGELKDRTVSNLGTVKFNGAQLGSACVTTGTLEFAANTTVADANYIAADTNIVDKQKTLTVVTGTFGDVVVVSGEGTVAVDGGTVVSKVGNFGDDIKLSVKSGVLEFTDGQINKSINNAGTVKLSGDATLGGAYVVGGTLEFAGNTEIIADYVSATTNIVDTELKLKTGTLKKKVEGAGNIVIDGEVSTNPNNLAVNGSVTVNDKLTFIGDGTLTKGIAGTGTTDFKGNVAVTNGVELNTANNNVTGTLDVAGNITATKINFESGSILKVDGDSIKNSAAITVTSGATVKEGSKLYVKNAAKDTAYKILAGNNIDINSWTSDADMAAGFKARFGLKVDTAHTTESGTGLSEFTIQFVEDKAATSGCDMNNIVSSLSANNNLKSWIEDVSYSQDSVKMQENTINTMANMAQLANVQNGAFAVSNLTMNTTFEHMSVFQRELTSYSYTPKLQLRNTAMERGGYESSPIPVGRVRDVLPVRSVKRVIDEDSRYRRSYRNDDDYYAPSRRNYDRDYDYSPKHYHYTSMTEEPDKTIWATYIHSKETINDMKVGHLKQDSTIKQNGAVVGADLWSNENSFGGVAITYATGDVTSSQQVSSVKNDIDHYGASIYHRQDMGKFSVQVDAGYGKSKNDIKMETRGAENVTLKPKTEAYSAGIKIEEPLAISEKTNLVPFLGVRYTFMDTKKAESNLNIAYGSNKQNMCTIPVGLSLRSYNQVSDGMKFGTTLEAGYVFNVGDRKSTQKLMYGGVTDTISYNIADKGQYFIKAAIQAICENMIWELGYHYSKSSKTKDDKWYVNANFDF